MIILQTERFSNAKETYTLYLALMLHSNIISAQDTTTFTFDIQHLIKCHNLLCETRNGETTMAYIEAFPPTLDAFRMVGKGDCENG